MFSASVAIEDEDEKKENAHWDGTKDEGDHHKSQLKDGTENTFRVNISNVDNEVE